jgi:hypothetical protein
VNRSLTHVCVLGVAVLGDSAAVADPLAVKPTHQQPPQTPLLASTKLAKSPQVSAGSGRVVYAESSVSSAMYLHPRGARNALPRDYHPHFSWCHTSLRLST